MNTGNEKTQVICSQLTKARESIGLSLQEAASRLDINEETQTAFLVRYSL